jgi:hypothetical protein
VGPRASMAAAGVAALVGFGAWLEQRPESRPLRERLQSSEVPAPLLNNGKLGVLLQRADLVDDVENVGRVFPPTIGGLEGDDPLVFRRKGRVGDRLYSARDGQVSTFPDSALPDEFAAPDELMVVSVAVDPADLDTIHERFTERLERRAEVTIYRDGSPVLTTRVGLRLHGGESRNPGSQHSYRLHLRDRYGKVAFPPGLLFEGALDPVPTLIIRRVAYQRFNSCLGYDIQARLGSDVPHTQPAWFYLNGERMGLYVLTEHLARRSFASRIGHDQFLLYRQRGVGDRPANLAYDRLSTWIIEQGASLRAVEVSRYIDLDRLTRYLLGIAVCGTVDWEQGACFLDLRDPDARWEWIPWDLDRGLRGQVGDPAFSRLLDSPHQRRSSVPARLLGQLLLYDPAYRESFVAEVCAVMNHELTPEFLEERQDHYAELRARWGPQEESDFQRQFLRARAAAIFEDLAARFELGPLRRCVVRVGDAVVEIDGFEHRGDYLGLYFTGQTLRVRAPGVSAWRVGDRDGERVVAGAELELVIGGDLDISVER